MVELLFLPSVYTECPECHGTRYQSSTLEILWHGRNIAEILAMSVEDAHEFFEGEADIMRSLTALLDVGLGYLRLGQPATELSGGEAQRVKLASELQKRSSGRTIYVLDEPTTGLHFEDIRKLLDVIQGLADKGNTVVVIEHNLDVIKCADWVVDMGPEGGSGGGTVVATGTPEQVASVPESFTGQFLAPVLAKSATQPIVGELVEGTPPSAKKATAKKKSAAKKTAATKKTAAARTPAKTKATVSSKATAAARRAKKAG